jgi:ABC-type transport system involved in multi-copper enzyme maturation permease subunit
MMATREQETGTQRVTVAGVLRSEWTKLRSLPAAAWSLAAAIALVVGFGAIYAGVRVSRPPADPSTFDATGVSLSGVALAQIAVGVLGVLVITSEYASGLVRTSFAAVPSRTPVLWSKVAILGGATAIVCLPAAFAAFLIGQSVLASGHLNTTLAAAGVLRAVVGGALYLTAVAVLGIGLGTVIRNTAGGIAALFGLLYGLQIAVGFLPAAVVDHIYKYLPAPAGIAISHTPPTPVGARGSHPSALGP